MAAREVMRPCILALAMLNAALLFSQVTAPAEPRRVALVIANSDYKYLRAAPAAKRDGELMTKALRSLGFQVTTAEDLTTSQFASLEEEFVGKLQPGDVCWIYYSGYAVHLDGVNFLVSVDFQPAATNRAVGHALVRLQQNVEQTGAALKVFVIENTRTTPELLRVASAPRLSVPDLQGFTQLAIAYATQSPGESAEGAEPGRFTAALADMIGAQGQQLFEIFQRVQAKVQEQSAGKQIPFYLQNISRTWFFREPVKQDVVRIGSYYPHPKDRQDYVWVPAGTFLMGCVPSRAEGADCLPEETPRHKVTITKSFWIGRNEVETSSYRRFVDADKSRKMPRSAPFWNKGWREESLPMAFVSWDESAAYCNWVGGRLPTEAEWEYAARAGSQDQVFPYQGSESREKANFQGKAGNDRSEDPAPVKKFDANAFGLYDMAGNVWEWVSDWYSPTYYGQSPELDPQGPATGREHSIRGGSFESDPREHLRISFRKSYPRAANAIGFRCVLEDTPAIRSALGVK